MTNTRIIFFSILIAILLAIFIMWCADVLAHGNPVGHFAPYTEADPCWNDACKDSEYRGGHGHIDDYDDENGNGRWDLGEENSWGYWTCGGYKHVVPETNCSEPKPPTQSTSTPTSPRPPTQSTSTPTFNSIEQTLEQIIENPPAPPVEIPKPETVPEPVVIETEQWEYQFWKGWNLVSFPVLPEGVETISDLYHHWAFFTAHNGHIVVNLDGEWTLYSGADGEPTGEIPLSAHLGLAVRLDWATYLGVRGVPLSSAETIDLHAGTNLVGFPEIPTNFKRPSDFLSDAICAVIVTRRGEFYLVGRAGDSGDEALEPGQAVILIATEPTTLNLTLQVGLNDQSVKGWGAEKVDGAN